ncbi:MAG: DUF47 family protein [Nitrososphaeria archaeon]|nr:DUF47 family protein [Aigarchaeota archaeon]MCX8187449.1 DUF47 family protein [Nitrososphaeria archaeon]MDW8021091.1 DUF47 family protein [Nitrososphaerota archaeon]
MTLPRDREEDFRLNILNLIQDQVRIVLNGYKILLDMLENFLNGAKTEVLEEIYLKIMKNDEEAKEKTRIVEKEISNVGALLTSRENFIRLASEIDKIADITEGAAFRILSLSKMKTKLGKNLNKLFMDLGQSVLETLTAMREALLATTLNSSVIYEKIEATEKYEKKSDDFYRTLDLELLSSELKVGQLLLCREVAEMIEDIADNAERVADILRALSIAIF